MASASVLGHVAPLRCNMDRSGQLVLAHMLGDVKQTHSDASEEYECCTIVPRTSRGGPHNSPRPLGTGLEGLENVQPHAYAAQQDYHARIG